MKNKLLTFSYIIMLSLVIGGCSLFRGSNVTELGAPQVKSYAADVELLLTEEDVLNEFLKVYKSEYEIDWYYLTDSRTNGLSWFLYGSHDIAIASPEKVGSDLYGHIEDIIQSDENVLAVSERAPGVFVLATDNGSDIWGDSNRLLIYDCNQGVITADSVIEETNGEGFTDMCVDDSGNIYVVLGSKIVKLDGHLAVIASAKFDDYFFESVCYKDGAVYLTSYSDRDDCMNLVKLKSDGLSPDHEFRITTDSNSDKLWFIGTDADSIYLVKNDRFLIRFLTGDNTLEQIANLDEYRIVCSGRDIVFDNGQFLIYGSYRDTNGLFSIKFGEEISGRVEIELAVMGVNDTWLDRRIADFNADNREYHITVKNYVDDLIPDNIYSVNDAEHFLLELSSGSVPDILCTNSIYASEIKHSEMLMDLYDCVDFRDSEFLGSVWNGMKESDGSMYLAAPFFRIAGFAGKSGNLFECDCEHVIRHDDVNSLSDALLSRLYSLDTYSSEDLYDYLEFIDKHKTLDYTENQSVASQLRSGELGYLDCRIGGFGNYLLLCEYFGEAPEIAMPMIKCDMFFGVFENTDCPEGARQFLEYCFSDEALSDDARNYISRIPVSLAVIDNIISITSKAYNGSEIKPGMASINGINQDNVLLIYSDNEDSDVALRVIEEIDAMERGESVDHTPLSPGGLYRFNSDDVQRFAGNYLTLLNSISDVYLPSNEMSRLAHSYLTKYYSGEISASYAAQEIDNAITKYISEIT